MALKTKLPPALDEGITLQVFATHQAQPRVAITVQHIHSLAGLVAQLSELSQYASELFTDLFDQTQSINNRLSNVQQRLRKAEEALPAVDAKCSTSLAEFDWQEATKPWRARIHQEAMLFAKERADPTVKRLYNQARPPPDLNAFDEFKEPDRPPSMKLYSDLDFFFERWVALQKHQERENKEKKRRKKNKSRAKTSAATTRAVRQVKVKKFDSLTGEVIEEDDSLYRKPTGDSTSMVSASYSAPQPQTSAAPALATSAPPAVKPKGPPPVRPNHAPPAPPPKPSGAPPPPPPPASSGYPASSASGPINTSVTMTMPAPPPLPPTSSHPAPAGATAAPTEPGPGGMTASANMTPKQMAAVQGGFRLPMAGPPPASAAAVSAAPPPAPAQQGVPLPPPMPSSVSAGSMVPPPPPPPPAPGIPAPGGAAPPMPPPPPANLAPPAPPMPAGGLGEALKSIVLKSNTDKTERTVAAGQDLLAQIREGKKLRPVKREDEARRGTFDPKDNSVQAILMRRFAMEQSDDESGGEDSGEWSD